MDAAPGVGRMEDRCRMRGRPSLAARWPGRGAGGKGACTLHRAPVALGLCTADFQHPPRLWHSGPSPPSTQTRGRPGLRGRPLLVSSELRPEEARLTASSLLCLL